MRFPSFALVLVACAPGSSSSAAPLPLGYPPFPETSARCDAGDPVSCAWVASMYRYGVGVAYSADHVERSLAYANRSCELGLREACTDLGMAYVEGGRDLAKAETLLTESCKRGQALACVHLALIHPDRMVPDSVAAAAFPVIDADCTAPAPTRSPAYVWRTSLESSCEIAGRMLEAGRGVPPDVKRARATYARGCSSSRASCDLAQAPDGEECPHGCRGAKEHSSSCIDGICEPDLSIGAKCKVAKKGCTRGSYCDVFLPEPTCAAKKPFGAPCSSLLECADEYCAGGKCAHPPVHTN